VFAILLNFAVNVVDAVLDAVKTHDELKLSETAATPTSVPAEFVLSAEPPVAVYETPPLASKLMKQPFRALVFSQLVASVTSTFWPDVRLTVTDAAVPVVGAA
jgi:hypothetical protein